MNLTYLEIDHARSEYDALNAEQREAFRERLKLSWLYHEHALEGTPLSRREIDRALEGKPCRNYCDGENQKSIRRLDRALDHIDSEAKAGTTLTVDWIEDLHSRLCDPGDDAAAEYRTRNTSPGVYNLDIVSSEELPGRLDTFVDNYRDELADEHPIRAAALAHWRFMRVFPFDERTGLVGRLMMNFLLQRAAYPPAVIHEMDRHHYFQALRAHSSDLVPVVVEAIRGTISAAERFVDGSSRSIGELRSSHSHSREELGA
jgi:Fic family protein